MVSMRTLLVLTARFRVTALGNPVLPVVLTVQPDAENYRNAVAHLLARWPKGFILLTPTKLGDAAALELLTKANLGFYDLESHLTLLASEASCPRRNRFGGYLPAICQRNNRRSNKRISHWFWHPPEIEEQAGRNESAAVRRLSLALVFERMKYRAAAKNAGCSIGAVSDRVRELRG